MVIFGGMHSVTGAPLLAIVLTSLPELLRAAAVWRLVLYGAMVIIIVVVRPEGLVGSWELKLPFLNKFWGWINDRLIMKIRKE